MKIWKFIGYTFAGSLVWSTVLTYVGFVLGKNWNAIHTYMTKFEVIIVIILAAVVVFYLYKKQE